MRRRYLLSDNGSLRPEATLHLRALARALSKRVGEVVEPVSLAHSHRVDAALLGGKPAESLELYWQREGAAGHHEFGLIPLFTGPSAALTIFVPEMAERMRGNWPGFSCRIAPELFQAEDADRELVPILADLVLATAKAKGWERPEVLLVDHGTPTPEVAEVAREIARRLEKLLGAEASRVVRCAMEGREGPDYDFNRPLLAEVLDRAEMAAVKAVAAMLFLTPGRHAGPGGDVATILEEAAQRHPGQEVAMTGLPSEDPRLIELLARRFETVRVSTQRDCG